MPKIIKDVEKTIRNCAFKLFVDLSYTAVDMKMISKKSGVAVGTLYNYYENKKQLYVSILKESWQNTFNKLDSISDLTISQEEKLLSCLDKVESLSKCHNINTKLAESLLVSTLVMLEFHPNDKKDNINFLVEFISLSMKYR